MLDPRTWEGNRLADFALYLADLARRHDIAAMVEQPASSRMQHLPAWQRLKSQPCCQEWRADSCAHEIDFWDRINPKKPPLYASSLAHNGDDAKSGRERLSRPFRGTVVDAAHC